MCRRAEQIGLYQLFAEAIDAPLLRLATAFLRSPASLPSLPSLPSDINKEFSPQKCLIGYLRSCVEKQLNTASGGGGGGGAAGCCEGNLSEVEAALCWVKPDRSLSTLVFVLRAKRAQPPPPPDTTTPLPALPLLCFHRLKPVGGAF